MKAVQSNFYVLGVAIFYVLRVAHQYPLRYEKTIAIFKRTDTRKIKISDIHTEFKKGIRKLFLLRFCIGLGSCIELTSLMFFCQFIYQSALAVATTPLTPSKLSVEDLSWHPIFWQQKTIYDAPSSHIRQFLLRRQFLNIDMSQIRVPVGVPSYDIRQFVSRTTVKPPPMPSPYSRIKCFNISSYYLCTKICMSESYRMSGNVLSYCAMNFFRQPSSCD